MARIIAESNEGGLECRLLLRLPGYDTRFVKGREPRGDAKLATKSTNANGRHGVGSRPRIATRLFGCRDWVGKRIGLGLSVVRHLAFYNVQEAACGLNLAPVLEGAEQRTSPTWKSQIRSVRPGLLFEKKLHSPPLWGERAVAEIPDTGAGKMIRKLCSHGKMRRAV